MEDWATLVVNKTKQIWDEYTAEVQRATNNSDVAAAIGRRDERLDKIRALTAIEDATQMILDCVNASSSAS